MTHPVITTVAVTTAGATTEPVTTPTPDTPMIARLTDRLRPWSAPVPPSDAPLAVVVGAGPAGLATAALLRGEGVRAVVVDRADRPGASWAARYDSLRLNTVRWMSDLPGLRMPRSYGRWVGRDDLVDYFERYARHHRLELVLGADGAVDRVGRVDRAGLVGPVGPSGGRFEVTGGRSWIAEAVVIATGHSHTPTWPGWPGRDRFAGRVLHAADYRSPAQVGTGRVLVVGAGSSGGEICVDLARAGVEVSWSVRSAPRLFPREVWRLPSTPFAPPAEAMPDAAVDRLAPWVERRLSGRRDYLPEPTMSMTELLARHKEPMTADGIVELIRSDRVRVVEAVADLDRTGALLTGGGRIEADVVIAATGYRPALDPLVGHLGVLGEDGRPTSILPAAGVGFVGFRVPLTGTLWAIEHDAHRVARALARSIR